MEYSMHSMGFGDRLSLKTIVHFLETKYPLNMRERDTAYNIKHIMQHTNLLITIEHRDSIEFSQHYTQNTK